MFRKKQFYARFKAATNFGPNDSSPPSLKSSAKKVWKKQTPVSIPISQPNLKSDKGFINIIDKTPEVSKKLFQIKESFSSIRSHTSPMNGKQSGVSAKSLPNFGKISIVPHKRHMSSNFSSMKSIKSTKSKLCQQLQTLNKKLTHNQLIF